MPIVLDASVAIKLVEDEDGSAQARERLRSSQEFIAPDWMLVEAASSLTNKVRYEHLPIDDAQTKFAAIPLFVDRFVPAERLLLDTMALAAMLNHALYDCLYLQLAIEEKAKVLTADDGLVKAASRAGYADQVERLQW